MLNADSERANRMRLAKVSGIPPYDTPQKGDETNG